MARSYKEIGMVRSVVLCQWGVAETQMQRFHVMECPGLEFWIDISVAFLILYCVLFRSENYVPRLDILFGLSTAVTNSMILCAFVHSHKLD